MGMKGIKVNNAAATKGTTGACDTTGDVSANNGCTAGGGFSASFPEDRHQPSMKQVRSVIAIAY